MRESGGAVGGGVEEVFGLGNLVPGRLHVLTHRLSVRALILFQKRLSRVFIKAQYGGPKRVREFQHSV